MTTQQQRDAPKGCQKLELACVALSLSLSVCARARCAQQHPHPLSLVPSTSQAMLLVAKEQRLYEVLSKALIADSERTFDGLLGLLRLSANEPACQTGRTLIPRRRQGTEQLEDFELLCGRVA